MAIFRPLSVFADKTGSRPWSQNNAILVVNMDVPVLIKEVFANFRFKTEMNYLTGNLIILSEFVAQTTFVSEIIKAVGLFL